MSGDSGGVTAAGAGRAGLPAPRPSAPRAASSVLAREGAGCGSVGDVPGAWLASAPLSPSLWIEQRYFAAAAAAKSLQSCPNDTVNLSMIFC